jgi:hypothetical protein
MSNLSSHDLRELLLELIAQNRPRRPEDGALQWNTVRLALRERLGRATPDVQRAVLAQWQELFTAGILAWGADWENPEAPFFHVTERGQRDLDALARSPGNPAGYLRYIASVATLNPVADSYLREGLACFTARLHKAAAVMVGAASESLVLELRDLVVAKLHRDGATVPKKLNDWRVKTVLDGLQEFFENQQNSFAHPLREEFDAYFQALPQPIRAARNEAGHPASVEPVSEEAVHASLLLFPELLRLVTRLGEWARATAP